MDYCRRHGLAATVRRAWLAAKRALFASWMVVFYCDLDDRQLPQVTVPRTLKVERLRTLAELSAEHLQEMTSFWNPKMANRNIRERFEKGASLWLVECEGRLAGYGWTIEGGTIEPYYFPLTQNDLHFFDFHVFPRYRGRGFNPLLVAGILGDLANNRGGRAYIEAAESNEAQLSSLRKTPFRRIGSVRSLRLFGHTFVSWKEKRHSPGDAKREAVDQILETAKSNER